MDLEIDGDKEMIKAMDKQRDWDIQVRNIEFTNFQLGRGDYFFVFKFGHHMKVYKKYARPKGAPPIIDRKVSWTNLASALERACGMLRSAKYRSLRYAHTFASLCTPRPALKSRASTPGT